MLRFDRPVQAVPLYLSEIAPAKARGALNILFQMATTLGILGGELVDYAAQPLGAWGWRLCLAVAGIPALVLLLGSLLLPETPNSLLERGHHEQGKAVLQKLRGEDVDITVSGRVSVSLSVSVSVSVSASMCGCECECV